MEKRFKWWGLFAAMAWGLAGLRPALAQPAPYKPWVGTYTSYFIGKETRGTVTLELKANLTAVMTTRYDFQVGSQVLTGKWSLMPNSKVTQLMILLKPPYKGNLILEPREGQLISTVFDQERFGKEGLRFVRSATGPGCGGGAEEAKAWEGTYRRSFTESRGNVEAVLRIKSGGGVTLTSTYQNKRNPVVQTGTWEGRGERVTVVLDRQDGRQVKETLVLEQRPAEWVTVEWNREKYGREPLRFIRVPTKSL